jgi:hypothetical protein
MAESKLTGTKLCEVEGLEIYSVLQKAKREGKDRIWIQIRQRKPKKWHVSTTLSYSQGLDVQFQRDRE